MVQKVLVAALGKTHPVDGFGGSDDDLPHAQFGGCLDDVVCRHGVGAEGLVVWHDYVTGAGCEVNYCVWGPWVLGKGELGHVEERGEGVESLAAV